MTPLRLAIIGAGHLGRIHARLATDLPDTHLVAVCDPSESARRQVATDTQTQPVADYRQLFGQIDAAIVAVPTSLHHAIGIELAQQGIHLFIEKPLAPTLEAAEALVVAANHHHVVLQVGHVERFNAALQSAAAYLTEPKFIEANRLSSYPFRSTDCGVVMDLMIHDLDIVLALANADVRSVEAFGITVLGGHEDVAQARITFENGCVANLTASRVSYESCRKMNVWTRSVFASLDFANGIATLVEPRHDVLNRQFEVGSLTPDQQSHLKEHLFEELLVKRTLESAPVNAIAEEQRDFVTSIRNHQAPRVPGTAGRDAVALAEHILTAIDQHTWDGDADGRVGPLAAPSTPILRSPHWNLTPSSEPPRRVG